MSYDPFQSVGATSGTANVAYGQSTGSQYQGADIADNLLFPQSGQVVTISAPIQLASGATITPVAGTAFTFGGASGSVLFTVGGVASSSGQGVVGSSGGGSGNITVSWSGFTPQGSITAANSGAFAPVGCLIITVPTSGNPTVKIPFFNS